MNFLKNNRIRNWGFAALVVIAIAGLVANFSPAATRDATLSNEVSVVSLDVAETIDASGSLEADSFASLKWKAAGTVEMVNVQPGDVVQADEVLITLQDSSASASIVASKTDLVNAQKDLEDLLNSGTDEAQAAIDLKTAKEDYDNAASYYEYLQTSKKVPLTTTELQLQQTPRGYQYVYNTKSFKGSATEDMLIEAQNDLALKQAEYQDAQRAYDRLKDGPNAQDVIAAQAKVDAAQANVNLLSIVAPFDGEVLSVEHKIGDVVEAGILEVNIANRANLYVETQVDESDIANVRLGNPAVVTLDALAGVVLTGEVSSINPVGESVSGVIKYTVRIDIDPVGDKIFLPLGATADVTIQVKEAAASLAVPLNAVQNDSSGEYVWLILANGATQRVDIVSHKIVGDLVVVTGDLRNGDRIQLVHESNVQGPRIRQ